ncbi:MAG TPA: long-chain fatty acid--CoA ligase [Candidatus Limnocylindria bacterium]|nr:long-chain fatty acid--CoA ligase [Candidatus Limnocylindria bacterium]
MTTGPTEATPARPMNAKGEPLVVPPERDAKNLVDLVHRAVERFPEREAIRWKAPKKLRADAGADDAGWVSRSYREMWEWVTELSLGLADLGLGPGGAACVIARTRPEWIVADLAALATGAITAPIYPQSEPNQAAFILNNVKASVVFVENAQQAAKIESIRADVPTLEHVITMDPSGKFPEGTLTFEDVIARAGTDPTQRRLWREGWQALTPDQVATVIHTSGTTANPKGAMLTHGNILFNFQAATQVIDLYETDLFLSWLPLSHIFERLVGEFLPLGLGATVAYAEPLIERLAQNMAEVRPTVMAAVPRFYERVYGRVLSTVEAGPPARQRIFHWGMGLGRRKYENHVARRGNSPWLAAQLKVADILVFKRIRARTGGRIRYLVSGSAPLDKTVGEFFYGMGLLILEGYGLTETSPFVSVNRPDDILFGTVGTPAPATEVKIDELTGEILVRGPQIMKGYLNDPAESAKAIDRDAWFHTGDVGELDEVGRIRITDRLKNIIVLANGKNVSPAPMEAALSTSKYIAQAVILGDNQPYTGGLIAPDLDEIATWAAGNGLAEVPPEQLIERREVQKLIDAEVKRLLEPFAIFERPRRIALLPRPLTEENGELTPTLKTKMRVVQQNWKDKIDYLFDEKGGSSSEG